LITRRKQHGSRRIRYGGVVDQGTLTIAVDWRAVGGDLSGLLAHELVHVMIRDITGRDAPLPAWFEEGLATVVQREDALAADTDALIAESLLSNGVVTLDQLATLRDWHRTFARELRAAVVGPVVHHDRLGDTRRYPPDERGDGVPLVEEGKDHRHGPKLGHGGTLRDNDTANVVAPFPQPGTTDPLLQAP